MPGIKEVADAYIEVHGDLTPFRRDLSRAATRFADAAGDEAGDRFGQALESRLDADWKSRWNRIADAFYSGEKLDWDRLFTKFDPTDIESARGKIQEFVEEAYALGLIEDDFEALSGAIDENAAKLQGHANATRLMAREISEAREEHDRFMLSLDGLKDTAELDLFERRWKEIGRTIAEVDLELDDALDIDWSKMAKGSKTLDDFDASMVRTIDRAFELGRITEDQSNKILDSVENYVIAEKERAAAIERTTREMEGATRRTEEWNRSLSGMIENSSLKEMAADFDRIVVAMGSANWSRVAQGHKHMGTMRDRVLEVSRAMQDSGRITADEYRRINVAVDEVVKRQRDFGVEIDNAPHKIRAIQRAMDLVRWSVERMQVSWRRMDSTVRLVMGLILAAAGPVVTLLSGLAGAGTAIVSSFAMAAGSIIPLGTGIGALALGVTLMVQSFGRLRDTMPGIQSSIEAMSSSWQQTIDNFAREWGPALDSFLDRLSVVVFTGTSFGIEFGRAMANVTKAFEDVVDSPGMNALMDAMSTTLPKAAEGFGIGFAGVMSSIITMMAAAAPVAQALGEDFARWGQNLAAALERGRESGELTQVFERMRESLLVVLDFLGSVGSALGTLFSLGADSGDRLLISLTGIVDRFNAWMQTEAGRSAMLEWFRNAETIVKSLGPFIEGIATALERLVTPQSIAMLGELSAIFGEVAIKVGEVLNAISQAGLLNTFGEALNLLGDALRPILGPLGELGTALGVNMRDALNALAPIFAGVMTVLRPFIEQMVYLAETVGPLVGPALERIGVAVQPIFEALSNLASLVTDVVAPVLGFLFTSIIDGVVNAIEGLSGILTGFGDLFRAIFEGDLPGILSALGGIFESALQAVWGIINVWIFGKILGLLREGLSQIPNLFRMAWEKAPTVIGEMLARIPGLLATLLVNLGTWFAGLGVALQVGIAAAFAGLGLWVSGGMAQLLTFFTTAWAGIVAWWNEAWNGLALAAQTVFTNLGLAVQVGWAYITTLFSTAWTAISLAVQTGWAYITSIFMTAWLPIQAVIQTGWAVITTVFQNAMIVIQTAIQAGWTIITTIFSTAWQVIQTVVATAILVVHGLITGNMTLVVQAIQAGWNQAVSLVTTALALIGSTISTAWSTITTATQTAWLAVLGFIRTAWSNITSGVTAGVNNARTAIQTGWQNVQTFTQQAWTNVMNFLRTAWTNIVTAVVSGINNALNSVRNGWLQVVSNTQTAWNNATTMVRTALVNIVNAVTVGLTNVVSFFINLPGRITSALSGLAGTLRGIGSDMIAGLIGGIESMAQGAITAVQNVVGGAIDWAKQMLNLGSPSKLFRQFGVWTGEGFIMGMEEEASAVQQAADHMLSAAIEAFEPSAMYVAGKDAAQGLADGFGANKDLFSDPFSGFSPEVHVGSGVGQLPGVSRGTVANGQERAGIYIEKIETMTSVADPEIVTEMVVDRMASEFSTL